VSSSNAPIPSESITRTLIGVPSAYYPIIGFFQIHNPLVHGLIVFPTPKPSDLFKSILFIRYDLPVRYIPTTEIIPIGPWIDLTKSIASSFIFNSKNVNIDCLYVCTCCLYVIIN
jgi:hypothetical protein